MRAPDTILSTVSGWGGDELSQITACTGTSCAASISSVDRSRSSRRKVQKITGTRPVPAATLTGTRSARCQPDVARYARAQDRNPSVRHRTDRASLVSAMPDMTRQSRSGITSTRIVTHGTPLARLGTLLLQQDGEGLLEALIRASG